MATRAGWYTPMLRVREIERSIPFYRLLGFELVDAIGGLAYGWLRERTGGGALAAGGAKPPPG